MDERPALCTIKDDAMLVHRLQGRQYANRPRLDKPSPAQARRRVARVTNYYNLPDWVRQVGG